MNTLSSIFADQYQDFQAQAGRSVESITKYLQKYTINYMNDDIIIWDIFGIQGGNGYEELIDPLLEGRILAGYTEF